ncbi:MAG: hypothetical protein HOP10_13920 [Chitinophagaceae bacterium]|nr:hypothetical protein [Chitinophagaceae bacterium]
MAASLNKWFFFPAFSLFLMIGGKKGLQEAKLPHSKEPHPFHVSVVEIEHNATDKTLEISCKIFTDDFETILAKNYNTKVDLTNPPNKAAMDTLVKKYIASHLSLKVGGKAVTFNYIGYEVDKEASWGYIEVENISSVSKLDVTNNILYDKFDDQMNIMHVKVGDNRKSTKLNYPDKETSFSF